MTRYHSSRPKVDAELGEGARGTAKKIVITTGRPRKQLDDRRRRHPRQRRLAVSRATGRAAVPTTSEQTMASAAAFSVLLQARADQDRQTSENCSVVGSISGPHIAASNWPLVVERAVRPGRARASSTTAATTLPIRMRGAGRAGPGTS